MGQIHVLDQNMINMIAAGEVIERPASVVKELMENSIDAGATYINVTIEEGGKKLISVSDNGSGMDAGDLERAFEPHSTSKISQSSDLNGISTLGFRGEALASIASIAHVKAVTRPANSDSAYSIEIDCGDKGAVVPDSGDYGTTITTRDIFYKLPARRKFLRTPNTETSHISEHFTRIALSNCHIGLSLTSNNKQLYKLSAGESLPDRIAQLFPMLGIEKSESFLEIENEGKGIKIFGFAGKPSMSRTSNRFQYVFLNGRFIRDKFISHAIKEAYRGMIDTNRYPVVFLYIEMPFSDYDVNVHPTKIEVRFFNSNLIHSQVLGCIREILLGAEPTSRGKFAIETTGRTLTSDDKQPAQASSNVSEAISDFLRKHRPRAEANFFESTRNRSGSASSAPASDRFDTSSYQIRKPVEEIEITESAQTFIQIHVSYIIEQTDDGFIIIDQHALHERIMYERLSKRLLSEKLQSQRLLLPETINTTSDQVQAIEGHKEILEKLGIEIEPFGPKTYAIQTFPTILEKVQPAEFLQDLLDILVEKGTATDYDGLLDEIINMAACKAAIKAGQKLSNSEIEQLLADRRKIDWAGFCPHGRPTSIKFTLSELAKQFKRT